MRLIAKPLLLLVIPLLAATGCAGVTGTPVGPSPAASRGESAAPSPSPSAAIVASPSPTGSLDVDPPTAHPAASPSIDGSFAVDGGTRKLALVCWGEGSPTVLLETGGNNIEEWTGSGEMRALASRVRVCTYDRAGTGASDPPPYERRDADDVVRDLKELLAAAKVDGPYVLIGQSFGGMVVTHYAERVPKGVLAVIVLDTPAPDATFTPESEPGLVWDYPGNTERLDVVGGFENHFAKHPPKVPVPVLVLTPPDSEASPEDESFWLQVSHDSRQLLCGPSSTGGRCTDEIVAFIDGLR